MEVVPQIEFEVFQVFLNVLKKKGAKETIKILNKDNFETSISDEYVLKVLKMVADEFAIDLNEILYDRYVRGENKYVIGFCVHYLYKDYSMNDLRKLGVFSNKDISVLSRYRQLVENLDPHHKNDSAYLKMKEKLDKKLKDIKK